MMRERTTIMALLVGAIAASVVLAAPVMAAPDQAVRTSETETVGGFAIKLASVFEIDARTPEQAVAALQAYGVNLGEDFSATLTEERATRILTDMGFRVDTPANPGQAISVGVSGQLATAIRQTPPGSTIESHIAIPFECLSSATAADCGTCCTANANCVDPTGIACRLLCRILCLFNKPPPPSPIGP